MKFKDISAEELAKLRQVFNDLEENLTKHDEELHKIKIEILKEQKFPVELKLSEEELRRLIIILEVYNASRTDNISKWDYELEAIAEKMQKKFIRLFHEPIYKERYDKEHQPILYGEHENR